MTTVFHWFWLTVPIASRAAKSSEPDPLGSADCAALAPGRGLGLGVVGAAKETVGDGAGTRESAGRVCSGPQAVMSNTPATSQRMKLERPADGFGYAEIDAQPPASKRKTTIPKRALAGRTRPRKSDQ